MSKTVFENYQSVCPNCGAELDSDHKVCPFCGINLIGLNSKYRDNEKVIVDAIDDINKAKQRIFHKENQLKGLKIHKTKSRISKMFVISCIVLFLAVVIAGFISITRDDIMSKKINEFNETISKQQVETIDIDEVNISDVEFVNTNKQAAVGYIQESSELLKIPFFQDSYKNGGIFKGALYLKKDKLVEVSSFSDTYTRVDYGTFSITIDFENDSYYDRAIDTLIIADKDDMEKTQRLPNIKVGDAIFECYKFGKEYHFIAQPYHKCFVIIEVDTNNYDDVDVPVEDAFVVAKLESVLDIE